MERGGRWKILFSANLILLMQKCLFGTVAVKVKLLPQFKNCNRVTTSDKCRRCRKARIFILFYFSIIVPEVWSAEMHHGCVGHFDGLL